jgi:hypothetical protein
MLGGFDFVLDYKTSLPNDHIKNFQYIQQYTQSTFSSKRKRAEIQKDAEKEN